MSVIVWRIPSFTKEKSLCAAARIEETALRIAVSNGNEAEEEHPIWIFSADKTNPAVTAVVTVTETDADATVAATAIDKHPARGCSKNKFFCCSPCIILAIDFQTTI
ncbi:MAG: hypothetical protein SO147_00320 [Clostridia bacterium]|nr:hypothetical protein [Clostridia bacterium]